jgi:hypothetical protein
MPRDARPSGLTLPPIAYTGDRERLEAERASIAAKLKREPQHSNYRPALQRRLVKVTAQLLDIERAPPPSTWTKRADLQ